MTTGRIQRPTVLVVDDDDDVRQILRLLFEFDDFEVTEAASGPEALARALRDDPDFIVLDHQMPGMAGSKVAPVLRALVPEARIVAFSAVLEEKPEWADSYLNKERVGEVSDHLVSLWGASTGSLGS